MTQEEKQLLFKDLSGRLPYGVLLNVKSRYANKQQNEYTMVGIVESDVLVEIEYDPSMGMMDARPLHIPIKDVKPYLRPMSSMSSKEWVEFCDCSLKDEKSWVITSNRQKFIPVQNREDYLNSKHFDYRGLIPMGLALEAPENMYKHFGDMDVVVTSVEHKDKL